jgi:hypothetical protein
MTREEIDSQVLDLLVKAFGDDATTVGAVFRIKKAFVEYTINACLEASADWREKYQESEREKTRLRKELEYAERALEAEYEEKAGASL